MTPNTETKTATLESSRLKDGKVEKSTNYYLLIEGVSGKAQINIGKGTYDTINKITEKKK